MAKLKMFQEWHNWTVGLLGRFEADDVTEHSASQIVLTFPGDYDDPPELIGFTVTYKAKTAFSYLGDEPVAGAVGSIEVRDTGGNLVMQITSIKGVNIEEIYRYIVQSPTDGPDPDPKTIMELVMHGNDTITGSAFNDGIGIHDDFGNDVIKLGKGDDYVEANAGNDTLDGGKGFDMLSFSSTRWSQTSFQGAVINLTKGTLVDPWGGTDTFKNFEGFEGSRYGDTLIGPDGEDPGEFYFWQGAAGRDKFILNEDANVWTDYYNDHNAGGERGIVADLGGIANKSTGDIKGTVIDGYGHKDTTTNIRKVAGTQHDDSFKGSRLNDHFNGEQGIDGFDGGKGTDFVHMDTTHRHGGGAINVNLSLGSGQIIDDGYGNTENAFSIEGIYGSVEGDTIIGSAGANVLFGMGGQDTLTGGLGKDKFVYGFYDNGSHNEFGDQITDFVSGIDKFVFDSKYVDDLDDVVRFHNGDTATAKAGNSEFYFNAADHTLYYDSNGKGAGGVIAVAVLDGVTSLVKADILIVPGYTDVV